MAEEQAHLEAGHHDGGVEEIEGVPPQISATPGMPERKAVKRRQDRVRENLHLLPKNAQEANYRVRPLNGVWATAPYLHNGSVPNLYALLSPVEERPKKFYLGNREYDPVNVGYRTDELTGGFEMDTTIRGNYNTGHEFSDASGKAGVIGRALTPAERKELIEYLKSL